MHNTIINPKFGLDAFNCPHCGAYSRQCWSDLYANGRFNGTIYSDNNFGGDLKGFCISRCERCSKYIIWKNERIIFPDKSPVEPPNCDLSQEIQNDYNEAANILNKSPRGAAALLRLCLQKLCIQLGLPGEKIDEDISTLVERGLPKEVQKAMDILRVTGNESVHPGVIDLNDSPNTAIKLFRLVNFIAEKMLTQPKEIEAFYEDVVPSDKKDYIEKRNKKALEKSKK